MSLNQGALFEVPAAAEVSSSKAPRCWVAVASAEHVARGRAEGFMQVCHGKATPLRRVQGGDYVSYYSPTAQFAPLVKTNAADALRAFTAIGVVKPGAPYQVEMTPDFVPFRRDVQWLGAVDRAAAPIAPLLQQLEFTCGKRNWSYQLRFGLFEVSRHDMQLVALALGLSLTF